MTLPPPVLLFDLDGTLTDSAPGILAGYRHALDTVGQPHPETLNPVGFVGPPMQENLRALGLDAATTARALAAYLEYYDGRGWAENEVYDGITPLLEDLVGRGVRLGVATSKRETLAIRILEHFDLARYFDAIAGASEDGARRAKADVIERALGLLEVRDGAVLVGDRHHDVTGAGRWGIPVIFAGWGYGEPAEAAGAQWVTNTVAELKGLLQ